MKTNIVIKNIAYDQEFPKLQLADKLWHHEEKKLGPRHTKTRIISALSLFLSLSLSLSLCGKSF